MQLNKIFRFAAASAIFWVNSGYAQIQLDTFTTIAGTVGTSGSANGLGTGAAFYSPMHVVTDTNGNIFVADYGNSTIREIFPVAGQWLVTTISGTAGTTGSVDNVGTSALLNNPMGITISDSGTLYIADYGNSTIRAIVPTVGSWSTYTIAGKAGTTGTNDGIGTIQAFFKNPAGIAVDRAGNLYVTDSGNHTIRKAVPVAGMWVVTTIAGKAGATGSADGSGATARFNSPTGVAVDSDGTVYVAEFGNDTIRRLTPTADSWQVSTIAGKAGAAGSTDGTNSIARFKSPMEIALDSSGNLYVADSGNHTIRQLTPEATNWVVTTLAGKAGAAGSVNNTGTAARFKNPYGVTLDSHGNLYVADTLNDTIRQGQPNTGSVFTVTANPATGGTVSGSGAYLVGTAVTISARANSGWTFTGWSDGGVQTHTITVPVTNSTLTANFVQQVVATPLFSLAAGTFSNSVTVTLKCPTSGATIRYTLDGSNPTNTSPLYKKALTFTNSVALTAQAFKKTMVDSAVAAEEFTIIPPLPMSIAPTSLTNGVAKVRYSATLMATGGVPPYKWSLVSGAGKLPAGLTLKTLNATQGIIEGLPAKATNGSVGFKVQVTDAWKKPYQQAFSLTVN